MNKSHLKFVVVLFGLIAFAVVTSPQVYLFDHPDTQAVAAVVETASIKDRPITSLRDLNNAFIEIASEVKPSVVTVFTEKTFKFRQNPLMGNPFLDFFYGPDRRRQTPPEQEYRQQGLGSGVIVSSDGNILTNHHVVAEADSIYVRTVEGKQYPATVVGSDPKTDIAVIHIDTDNLTAIKLGNSDDLQVGELVLAVGSPMSENLAHTVTQGIVSAKGRSNIGLADYEDFIQTDAAINPGNSGGALVNLDGELVGINSAIVSRSGGFQGIGFAVPSNMAVGIMKSLLSSGKVVRGWLGVSIQEVNEAIAGAMGLKGQRGALVGDVLADSPADKAGLEAGDVIVGMDGRDIDGPSQLRNSVAAISPGTKVEFEYIREGDSHSVNVTLGELPGDLGSAGTPSGLEDLLGFVVTPVNPDLARKYGLSPNITGPVVTNIDPNSAAFRAGLREGDVIGSVNRRRVDNVDQFNDLLSKAEKGDTVLLRIYRDDGAFFVAFTL